MLPLPILASIIGGAGRLAGAGIDAISRRQTDKRNSLQSQVRQAEAAGFSKNAIFALGGHVPSQPGVTGFSNTLGNIGQEYMGNQASAEAIRASSIGRAKTEEEIANLGLQGQDMQRRLDAGLPETVVDELQSRIGLQGAQTAATEASTNLTLQQTEKVAAEITKLKQDTEQERELYVYEILERDLQLDRAEVALLRETFEKDTYIAQNTPLNTVANYISTGDGDPTKITDMIERAGQLVGSGIRSVLQSTTEEGTALVEWLFTANKEAIIQFFNELELEFGTEDLPIVKIYNWAKEKFNF